MSEQNATKDRAALEGLRAFIESKGFNKFIVAVILINAVVLGLETWPPAMNAAGWWLQLADQVALAIFVAELLAKLLVWRLAFFKSGWNIFDFVIVAIAIMPTSGPLSVLRALRILRVLRLISVVPEMRRVVNSLLAALPGMGSIAAVMFLIFYVGSVLATKLFGERFPDWFGSIGGSMYSLFQIMTLESWSMGIVRPVMEVYPLAWMFFVPFILVTTFAVVNLVVAVIVNSMQTLHDEEKKDERDAERQMIKDENEALSDQIKALRSDVAELKKLLAKTG
jgi:voltage-gated sodium channel